MIGVSLAFASQALRPDDRAGRATEPPTTHGPAVQPTLTVDAEAPVIRITRPQPDTTLYSATETLRGRTDPGATLRVIEVATGTDLPVTVDADGRFTGSLPLTVGTNDFILRSRDASGNEGSTRLSVTRQQSVAWIDLTASVTELAEADLPTTVHASALVHDDSGRPADGIAVTFSVSPPNRPTSTYEVTSAEGRAEWNDVFVPDDGRANGIWLLTALAVLPSGTELRGAASFTVR